MARVGRMRAATGAKHYGSTRHSHHSSRSSEVFDASIRSIDTLKSEDQDEAEFSCEECCKATPSCLFNFTVGACINCCMRTKRNEQDFSSIEDMDVRIMKERLKFHFMNPFEKWRYSSKRRFPWKLILQLLSIILVTLQLVLFANNKFGLTDFLQGNKRTFTQLFVLSPKDPDYSNPVPDPIRVIYTNDDLLKQLNYTALQYFYIEQVAVGPYGYQWDMKEQGLKPHLHLKIRRYKSGDIDPTTKTYDVSSQVITEWYKVENTSNPIVDAVDDDWDRIQKDLPGVLDIRLDFTLSSVYIPESIRVPKCFQFNISFMIDNDLEKGNMPMDMAVETRMSGCDNDSNTSVVDVDSGVLSDTRTTVVDVLVILVSILSILLCARSLISSLHFCKAVRKFFIEKFDWRLKAKHFVPLFNLWFVGIIVSNGMVLVGSIMKLVIAYTNPDSLAIVDVTSIILGLAVFGQWCGLLRFLSYFDKYNMLLITLRLAMPNVLRFGVCAGILYISFLLLGWLVLGPYHPKFRDPSTTSECLFSLLNGDDMFATYMEMSNVSNAAWIFSKVYLYTFISLFIYVVLSVFISLISDTYETLHDHWKDRTRGLLKDFATDQLGRGRLRSGSHHSHHSMVEEDRDDYDLMRDIAEASSEHQPLMPNGGPELMETPPTDASGHLLPPTFHGHTHKPVDPSIQNM